MQSINVELGKKKLLPGKIHFKPMYVEKGSLMFVFTIKSANLQC